MELFRRAAAIVDRGVGTAHDGHVVLFRGAGGIAAPWVAATYTIGKAAQFALPVGWWWRGHGQRPSLRFDRRAVGEGVGSGLLVAVAMWCTHRWVLWPSGLYAQAQTEITTRLANWGLDRLAPLLALAVFYSVLHSLFEEWYWRWFVFGGLRARLGLTVAVTLAAVGFSAHHVLVLGEYFGYASPVTWLLAGGVAIGGAYWSWLYHRSRSLLGPWLSHALIDAAIFALGYDLLTA